MDQHIDNGNVSAALVAAGDLQKAAMVTINMAHLREQGINFAVFDADAVTHMGNDRSALLTRLTVAARRQNLRVDKSALAFQEGGRNTFYGTPDLVQFLARNGVPRWTHTLSI